MRRMRMRRSKDRRQRTGMDRVTCVVALRRNRLSVKGKRRKEGMRDGRVTVDMGGCVWEGGGALMDGANLRVLKTKRWQRGV